MSAVMCLLWQLSQGAASFSGLFCLSGRRSQWQRKQSCCCRVTTLLHLTCERTVCICLSDMWAVYVILFDTKWCAVLFPSLPIIHQKKKEKPKQTNKHRNYRRLFQAAAFNHQKQISVSVEAKSGMPLLSATLLPDTHPSSPPVPASPASSLTPTTYKSWHNTQRWWTSQAQTTICSA